MKFTPSRLFNLLIDIAGFMALIALLAMMLLTTTDVFFRFFFDSPILGSIELVEILMVTVAGLSLAWCTLKSGHIRVDLLISMFNANMAGF